MLGKSKVRIGKVFFWMDLVLLVVSLGFCVYVRSAYDPDSYTFPPGYIFYRYLLLYTFWFALGHVSACLLVDRKPAPAVRLVSNLLCLALMIPTLAFFGGSIFALLSGGLSHFGKSLFQVWMWVAENPTVLFIPGMMLGVALGGESGLPQSQYEGGDFDEKAE